MKEIGSILKNKREENGLSIEEVSDDLKVDVSDINSIEDGDREHFKDINILKDLIQNYAKYLGIDGEQLLDQFNEYLFDQTSRISLEDIEKARDMIKEDKSLVNSPYTIDKKSKNNLLIFLILLLIFMVVFFVSFFVVRNVISNNNSSNEVSYIKLFGGE